jgi:hypothetical protein
MPEGNAVTDASDDILPAPVDKPAVRTSTLDRAFIGLVTLVALAGIVILAVTHTLDGETRTALGGVVSTGLGVLGGIAYGRSTG